MADQLGDDRQERKRRQRRLERALSERGSEPRAATRDEGPTQDPASDAKSASKSTIRSRDITRLKYFGTLKPVLERLHDDGCQRDKARNRQLHFDQYCQLSCSSCSSPPAHRRGAGSGAEAAETR